MINKLFIMDLKEKDKNSVHKSMERAKTFKKTMADLKVAQTAAMEKVKQANDKLAREQASAVTQKAQALAQKTQSIASAFALKQEKENALNALVAGGWKNSQFLDSAGFPGTECKLPFDCKSGICQNGTCRYPDQAVWEDDPNKEAWEDSEKVCTDGWEKKPITHNGKSYCGREGSKAGRIGERCGHDDQCQSELIL